jgi:hypothetical protein
MTCPKCNALHCYICNTKLYIKNNTKYWHFRGHELSIPNATCPLWNNNAGDGKQFQGNKEYNIKVIETELRSFLIANNNDKGIKKIICERICLEFYKDKEMNAIAKTFRTILHEIS